jgi:galactokinase
MKLGDMLSETTNKGWGESVITRLTVAGMSRFEATTKMSAMRHGAQVLAMENGVAEDAEAVAFFVPGRIEVVGKHTDYGGGRSVLCAVERGFSFVATPRTDDVIRLSPGQMEETAEFRLEPELAPEMGTWKGYPQAVARRMARNFPSARRGAEITFVSDLPRASGMSSSSAMVVGMFLVLAEINRVYETAEYQQNVMTQEDLAGYLGTNENGQTFKNLIGDRGVGTFGGSEDHTAILLGQAGKLVQYAYCPVRKERVISFPEEYVFAIASSGVVAEKTGAAMASYNRVSLLARAIVGEWNRAKRSEVGTLAEVIQAAGGAEGVREMLRNSTNAEFGAGDLTDRFEQFYAENEEIVAAFGDAMEWRDWEMLGHVMDRSQKLSETKLKNQVPQTVELARMARELGAVAASAFGAGFGGSVWAMVPGKESTKFLMDWKAAYTAKYAEEAGRSTFFVTRPGPAAFRVG